MTNKIKLFKPLTTSVATIMFIGLSVLSTNIHAADTTEHISVVKKEGKNHHKSSSFKKYFKRLNLTDEQKGQLKIIQAESKAERKLYKDDEKAYKASRKLLLENDALNEEALTDLHAQYQSTFAAIELARTKKMFAVKQVLTEEQFSKLKTMMKNKKKGKKKGKNTIDA